MAALIAAEAAVALDPGLSDSDAEPAADPDESHEHEDMSAAAAVLEAAPDVPAGLIHADDDVLEVDSILSWELGKDLAASGFAEPAVEDAIETHPDTMPADDDVNAIARRWLAETPVTLQALEWAGSERCQTHGSTFENSVALVAMVAPTEEAGAISHVARWMTFNDKTTWEGRFVTVSTKQNYRIEYTMPSEKDVFANRIPLARSPSSFPTHNAI